MFSMNSKSGEAVDSRIWEIVFYLMDNLRSPATDAPSLSDISGDLRNLGYSEDEISSAYTWMLDNVSGTNGVVFTELATIRPWHRVLSPSERAHFTPRAFAHLMKLTHSGDLDGQNLEEILDRVEFLGALPVDLEQLDAIARAIETEIPEQFYGETTTGLLN
jgi:hypothetical protein